VIYRRLNKLAIW